MDRHYSLLIDPDYRYCGGANYVMKIDDDVKVDYNLLINKLKAERI